MAIKPEQGNDVIAQPECIACLFRQALNTARIATPDTRQHTRILKSLAGYARTLDLKKSPAALSDPLYALVAKVTGVRDPYARQKRETNEAARALLPAAARRVAAAADPLKAALHLAVAGNIIDLGINHPFDLKRDVARIMRQPFAIDHYADFLRDLKPGRRLLYLGDNCGEIVFDTVLVSYLLKRGILVTYVVKSAPIINDATLADAEWAGLPALCPVIETGSNAIGVGWNKLGAAFRRELRRSDLILGKGHGNFETCIGRKGNFYFLLKAKCDIVANELGVRTGSSVFKHVWTE